MLEHIRGLVTTIISPVARLLLRLGVSPDAVTLVGTLATCTAALWFAPRGDLVVAALSVTLFALFDLLDGTMARMSGRVSMFGAFLDSTLDRIADGALFGGLALYFAWHDESHLYLVLCLVILVMGAVTSYARAKADHLGYDAKVGIAERPDRLVGMGAVPLQNTELAIAEMRRCVGELGLRGIEIGSNVNGRELADPSRRAFFAAAEDLGVMLFLLGATFLALGLFTSSLTQNQIVAAVLAFALTLILYILGAVGDIASTGVASVIRYASISDHFFDFVRGIVNLKDVIYFLSVIAAALFMTVRSLETRRWGS